MSRKAKSNPPKDREAVMEQVRQTCLRFRRLSPSAIADRCRWSGEPRIKAPAIRALLDTLTP